MGKQGNRNERFYSREARHLVKIRLTASWCHKATASDLRDIFCTLTLIIAILRTLKAIMLLLRLSFLAHLTKTCVTSESNKAVEPTFGTKKVLQVNSFPLAYGCALFFGH